MSSHRQLPYGQHAAPRQLSQGTVWYLLGISVVVFWSLVVLLVVLL